MGELFENFKDFDFPAAKKKAIAEGRAEGIAKGREEGIAEGRAQGMSAGEARVNKLIQLLIEQSREAEIKRAVSEKEFQEALFREFDL